MAEFTEPTAWQIMRKMPIYVKAIFVFTILSCAFAIGVFIFGCAYEYINGSCSVMKNIAWLSQLFNLAVTIFLVFVIIIQLIFFRLILEIL